MIYGSVCSGVEAATVAWHPLGWKAAWYSEIEPFPSAVLKHHYPTVPNYGDMTQYEAWPNESINLLVGGTPCVSFSVAGLRKGLADPRGNLMLTFGAIAKRYSPKWLVWENVPGVLSSNNGKDFGTFLGMLAELGYGFAYRVLDAQYFGVAQRRRRVFVVGYLGDWHRAAAVLFERHSLCGHPPPSRETRQDAAKCLTESLGMRLDPTSETFPIASTLEAHDGAKWGSNQWVDQGKAIVQPVAETLIATDHKGPDHNRDHNFVAQPMAFPWQSALDPIGNPENLSGTLIKNQTMAVAQPIPYDFFQITAPVNRQAREPGDPCHTLARDNAAHATILQPVAFRDPSPTLTARMQGSSGWAPQNEDAHLVGVAQPYVGGVDYENNGHTMDEPTGPLLKGSPTGGGRPLPAIATAMQVRRLTPVECERLQGFPDGYTNIPWRGKSQAPDGPRYKAMGNSMAVPVMHWIGKRIAAVDAL